MDPNTNTNQSIATNFSFDFNTQLIIDKNRYNPFAPDPFINQVLDFYRAAGMQIAKLDINWTQPYDPNFNHNLFLSFTIEPGYVILTWIYKIEKVLNAAEHLQLLELINALNSKQSLIYFKLENGYFTSYSKYQAPFDQNQYKMFTLGFGKRLQEYIDDNEQQLHNLIGFPKKQMNVLKTQQSQNLWQELKKTAKPIIGLSPMDGLTNAPFRHIIAKYGKPDILFTEFVAVDALMFSKQPVIEHFVYGEHERPIIAQIFGLDPELYYFSAQLICELGFDGIDVNMGCPSKNVAGRGAGAGLIKNPELAAKIMKATKQGVSDWVEKGVSPDLPKRMQTKLKGTREYLQNYNRQNPQFSRSFKANTLYSVANGERHAIPVSLKTRIGYNGNEVETWIPQVIAMNPANITLHGRSFKQMYTGQADWQAIQRAAILIKESGKPITFLGNGDVLNHDEAIIKLKEFGTVEGYSEPVIDGLLIGRGTWGNPWCFLPNNEQPQTYAEKLPAIMEHVKIHDLVFPENFVALRRHLAWYFKGFPGVAELRAKLVSVNNIADVESALSIFKDPNHEFNNP